MTGERALPPLAERWDVQRIASNISPDEARRMHVEELDDMRLRAWEPCRNLLEAGRGRGLMGVSNQTIEDALDPHNPVAPYWQAVVTARVADALVLHTLYSMDDGVEHNVEEPELALLAAAYGIHNFGDRDEILAYAQDAHDKWDKYMYALEHKRDSDDLADIRTLLSCRPDMFQGINIPTPDTARFSLANHYRHILQSVVPEYQKAVTEVPSRMAEMIKRGTPRELAQAEEAWHVIRNVMDNWRTWGMLPDESMMPVLRAAARIDEKAHYDDENIFIERRLKTLQDHLMLLEAIIPDDDLARYWVRMNITAQRSVH